MIDDETSVDAWILYRDLLIADTGYPAALTPGRFGPGVTLTFAADIADATNTEIDWDGLVSWLSRARNIQPLDVTEANAIGQRLRATEDAALESWLQTRLGDPAANTGDGLVIPPSPQVPAAVPIVCQATVLDENFDDILIRFDAGERCQPIETANASAFEGLDFRSAVIEFDRLAFLSDYGLIDFPIQDQQLVVQSIWRQGVTLLEGAGGLLPPGDLSFFGILAERALSLDVTLQASDPLIFSIERIVRWDAELPDTGQNPDPIQGVAVLVILDTLDELSEPLERNADDYLDSLVGGRTAYEAPLSLADAAIVSRWVGADVSPGTADESGGVVRSLLALDSSTECSVVAATWREYLDSSGGELTFTEPMARAWGDELRQRCDVDGTDGRALRSGLPLVDLWTDAEIACIYDEQPEVTDEMLINLPATPGLGLTIVAQDGDPRLVIDSESGLPSVLGSVALLRLERINELGCGGATLWQRSS